MNTVNRILLIDDDMDDGLFMTLALRDIFPEVVVMHETDSETVFKKLSDNVLPVPDVVLLDLNMPKISGKECLVLLKTLPRFSSTPVIICTTSNSPKDKTETLKLGASYFLTKPTSVTAFRIELASVLKDLSLQ